MLGKLQSNKVKYAVKIFDYIHSVDSKKIAQKIADEEAKVNKKIKIFIQVNLGNEIQKSGIPIKELDPFYNYCKHEINLNIIGLMVIPPNNTNPKKYFNLSNELNNSLALQELSMGMSSDYLEASQNKATFIRIGSNIFGQRT